MSPALPDVRLHTSVRQPWIAGMSRIQRLLASLTVAVFIFFAGGVLDWLVRHQYLPRLALMLAGATVSLAVGLLVLKTLSEVQQRYSLLLQRLERIAQLNQHIRDALQIIVLTNAPERSVRAIQQVNSAVLRIEAVLQEDVAARH